MDKQKLLSELYNQIISELSKEELGAEITESDEYCLNPEMKIRNMRKVLQPAAQAATPRYAVPITQSSLSPLAETFEINRNQTSSFSSQQMYEPIEGSSSQFHKLPKLEIKTFDGNILYWQSFWDSYETAVHSNHSLTDAQKFNNLKSLLQNEALCTVSGFALTNVNCNTAIEILHQRFGQT